MKTSRIIFISFFSTIGVFMITLMILGFIYNDKENSRKHLHAPKSVSLPLEPYNHIAISNDCRVSLVSDTVNLLSYNFNPDSAQIKPDFKISNDTLFVLSTQTNLSKDIQLKVNNSVTIFGNLCNLTLNKFYQKSLSIDVRQSEVRFNAVSIDDVEISLRESSRCNGWDFTAQKVTLNTRNSTFELNFKTKLKVLEGNITDGSNVRLPQALHYNLNVDESSKVRMY